MRVPEWFIRLGRLFVRRRFSIDDYLDNVRIFDFRWVQLDSKGKKHQWQKTIKVGDVKIDFTPERTIPHAIRNGRTQWSCRTLAVIHRSADGKHYVISVEPLAPVPYKKGKGQ